MAAERAAALGLPAERWRIADVELTLFAAPKVASLFAGGHGPRVGAVSSAEPVSLDACIELDAVGEGTLWVGDQPIKLLYRDTEGTYAVALLLSEVAAFSRSCLFIHASAAAVEEGAALVTGPSGHGKSTLCRALQELGAMALADDVAAVRRETGKMHRPKGHPADSGLPAEIPVRDVFILRLAATADHMRLAVDRYPAGWQQAVSQAAERGVRVVDCDDHWEIRCNTHSENLLDALLQHLARTGVLVLRDLAINPACFGQDPLIEQISAAQAVPAIVAEVFGRQGHAPGAVVMETAAALRNARFWLLRPGDPRRTAEAVLTLMSATGNCG